MGLKNDNTSDRPFIQRGIIKNSIAGTLDDAKCMHEFINVLKPKVTYSIQENKKED